MTETKQAIKVDVFHQNIPGGGPCLSIDGERVCWPKPKESAEWKYSFRLKIADLLNAVPGLSYTPQEEQGK